MASKLPKHIIKKYGISKKAWQVFRASKSKVSKKVVKSKSKTSTKKLTRSKSMAKRKRSYKKKKDGFKLPAGASAIIGAVGYGMVREKLSDTLANTQVVQRLPVTEFTDEAVMLGVNWGARKLGLGKMPVMNSVLRAQKTIELARVGQTIADMRQSGNGLMPNAQKTNIFIN
jgi:hypothetical protein